MIQMIRYKTEATKQGVTKLIEKKLSCEVLPASVLKDSNGCLWILHSKTGVIRVIPDGYGKLIEVD